MALWEDLITPFTPLDEIKTNLRKQGVTDTRRIPSKKQHQTLQKHKK